MIKDMENKNSNNFKPLLTRSKWDVVLVPTNNNNTNNDKYVSTKAKTLPFKKRAMLNADINNKTKYLHLKEISNVKGFIVNVHGPTDFDIDFELFPDLLNNYSTVISNKYMYKDISDNYQFLPGNILSHSGEREGTAYRCRLRGISVDKNQTECYKWKANSLRLEILQLIDRTDRWVTCNLLDIDVYQRLLVDITIHTLNETINLTDFLLEKTTDENKPIFFEYSKI